MLSLGGGAPASTGYFLFGQCLSVLVNLDTAHGGTTLSPLLGIAMDPAEQFSKGNQCALQLGQD